MARIERWREILTEPFNNQRLQEKQKEGWKLVGLEWERRTEAEGMEGETWTEEVPYGLRVANDCLHLEENPAERGVLKLILGLIAADHPLSKVAEALNSRAYRTRRGIPWTQTAVFDLLPRLIEAAPQLRRTPVSSKET